MNQIHLHFFDYIPSRFSGATFLSDELTKLFMEKADFFKNSLQTHLAGIEHRTACMAWK